METQNKTLKEVLNKLKVRNEALNKPYAERLVQGITAILDKPKLKFKALQKEDKLKQGIKQSVFKSSSYKNEKYLNPLSVKIKG